MEGPNTPAIIALVIVQQLIKRGVLDQDDAIEIAENLQERGLEDEALAVTMAPLYANQTPQAEWEAQQRRSRFEIVPKGE